MINGLLRTSGVMGDRRKETHGGERNDVTKEVVNDGDEILGGVRVTTETRLKIEIRVGTHLLDGVLSLMQTFMRNRGMASALGSLLRNGSSQITPMRKPIAVIPVLGII
jgi:hypothetical protein